MSMVAYVNGEFVPEEDAKISIFDRGFMFGDGVYEVTTVVNGKLIDRVPHMQRLERSLKELRIDAPLPFTKIDEVQEEMVARNNINEGRIYLQVTRGAADRDFPFPADAAPTLIMFAREVPVLETTAASKGIRVMPVDDIRWGRRDIKTVMLLASVLAKQTAKDNGFDDAWLVQDGFVTEGSSNNAYIVKDGKVITRPLSNEILAGCTRKSLLKLAETTDIQIEERLFTIEEAMEADEAFVTSATTLVTPVVGIGDRILSNGAPGPVANELRRIYVEYAKNGG